MDDNQRLTPDEEIKALRARLEAAEKRIEELSAARAMAAPQPEAPVEEAAPPDPFAAYRKNTPVSTVQYQDHTIDVQAYIDSINSQAPATLSGYAPKPATPPEPPRPAPAYNATVFGASAATQPVQPAQPQAQPAPQPQPVQPTQQTQASQHGAYRPQQSAYPHNAYGTYQPQPRPPIQPLAHQKDHVAAGLLGIFLGAFGIHKFYLGYHRAGFIMLGITLLGSLISFGLAGAVMWVIGVVEGIMYLVKPQIDFEREYVFNNREWF